MKENGQPENVSADVEGPYEKQSQNLAAEMGHWLNMYDTALSNQDIPLSQRPLHALSMLISEEAIEIYAGDKQKIIDPSNIHEHLELPYFRAVFEAVNRWYIDRFGEAAMKGENEPLVGTVMVHGQPFELRVPANRMEVEIEGEQAWMYFEEGLAEGEVADAWIIDGPELSRLDRKARSIVADEATRTASILRYVEFRRVTARSDGDAEVSKLVQSTLAYLAQAARRMIGGRRAERGPAWFDLQMANEAALKAVIRLETGMQPHIHPLGDLLAQANVPEERFDPTRLEGWPPLARLFEWRYGQGAPAGIGELYSAYLTSLDLIKAAMEEIPPGMPSGFRILIKYSPWSAKDATGAYRKSE